MAYRLGVDLGTTSTAAAVSVDGAPPQMIMLSPDRAQLPSTLYVTEDGAVLVGAEAAAQAAAHPARAIVDPLQRLAEDRPGFDDGSQHVGADEAVAAILQTVVEAAAALHGGPPESTALSHPVGWEDYQLSCLARAAEQAGLVSCSLVPDVQAGARHVVARADPGPDARFMIIDLGGGSCTVAVAGRTPTGVEVLGHDSARHPSGADFDEAVFRLVGGSLGDHGRELTKDEPAARARATEVRQACREAKEILSTASEASVTVSMPGFSKTVRIGRAEFESLVRPDLREGLALATRLLQQLSLTPDQLVGVALVGGASRMPVVAELVGRDLDLPVVLSDAPELDIAQGLVAPAPTAAEAAPIPTSAPPVPPAPPPAPSPPPPVPPPPPPAPPPPPPAPPPPPPTPLPLPPAHRAPGPVAAASTTEQPMSPTTATPEHLIFDYFAGAPTEPLPAVPTGSSAALSPRSPQVMASAPATPPQRPVPPGPGGRPPGQRPGPPTQPYGAGGRGGPGGPGYPPQAGGGSGGPLGSRRNLILAIVGGVVGVGAAIGLGFWLFRPETTVVAPPTGQVSAPPATAAPSGASPTPSASLPSTSATSSSTNPSAPGTPTAGSSSSAPAGLPVAAPLPANLVVVPMRTDSDDDDERPFYLVDSSGAAEPVKLPDTNGNLANPMLQKDRTSIIFLEGGKLYAMASDGSGERDLADREPAGCDNVSGASWSQADAGVMVISCRLSKNSYQMFVVDTEGRLIRRLDAGEKRFGDVTVSPDGQTVLFWASASNNGDGGSLYTLPLIGTGDPKKITSGSKGLDGDPSWSPDGSQISFRRLVGGADGNADVYVMNADGSAQREVAATEADDVKPVWSPDGKSMLIISNRTSAFGSAGKTWDLWLTRVSDGEVLSNFDLEADQITTPTWTYR